MLLSRKASCILVTPKIKSRHPSHPSTLAPALDVSPRPDSLGTKYQNAFTDGFDAFNVILFILIAFVFVPAAWIAYVVREKETKCKHQQARTYVLSILL